MQSLRILPHIQTEWTHVHKMPNVGLLGGVWPRCCEHALLPSDRCCVAWKHLQLSLRGTWRQRLKGHLVRQRTRSRRSRSGWRKCRATGACRVNAWPTRLHCRCLPPTQPCRTRPRELRRVSQRRSIWPHRAPARQSRRVTRKPRTPQQGAPGLRSGCWSWRRHCRRTIRHQPRCLRQKDLRHTQEAATTSHELPGQEV